MPPNTLQHIEAGTTKGLSVAARRALAPALQVREDQLMQPIGIPFDPLPGEHTPVNDLIFAELRAIHETLREMLAIIKSKVDRQLI
jgi:transcriptional regulator with XRE-family HTH domain